MTSSKNKTYLSDGDETYISQPEQAVKGRTARKILTLHQVPNDGEMLKPRELIQISVQSGHELTAHDRNIYNTLLRHAHGPRMAIQGETFRIPMAKLRFNNHNSNDRLRDSLHRLQRTLVLIQDREVFGTVNLLSYVDLPPKDGDFSSGEGSFVNVRGNREHGYLRYEIHHRLCTILGASEAFAKLDLAEMRAFTSKYSMPLYECVALRRRLDQRVEKVPLRVFREQWLGVADGKYPRFGNLKQEVIDKAVAEVNLIAPFNVSWAPYKDGGRAIAGVTISWHEKTEDERRQQYNAVQSRQPAQRDMFPETLVYNSNS